MVNCIGVRTPSRSTGSSAIRAIESAVGLDNPAVVNGPIQAVIRESDPFDIVPRGEAAHEIRSENQGKGVALGVVCEVAVNYGLVANMVVCPRDIVVIDQLDWCGPPS